MMEVVWIVSFGGWIGFSVIGCVIVDLLDDISDERRRRKKC